MEYYNERAVYAFLLQLATLMPLVHYNCSRHLRFFLCSVYAPVCSEHVAMRIPACKPLCLSVRRDCEPTLRELSLPWPHMLDCDRFPDSGNTLCVQPPPEENLPSPSTNTSNSQQPLNSTQQQQQQGDQKQENPKQLEGLDKSGNSDDDDEDDDDDIDEVVARGGLGDRWPAVQPIQPVPLPANRPNIRHRCPPRFVETPYVDVVSFPHSHFRPFMLVTSCVPRCGDDAYYKTEDKRFVERWMVGWAWLCFLSTLFSLLTYWVEPSRFRYPERPVVFLALCHNLLALAYILRGALGPEILGCATQEDGPSYVPVNDGLRSASCTLWWLARYYLSLASSFWWMILCCCWLLSAKNEWSSEALHNIAPYLHSVAWGLPVLFTAGSLVSRAVAADELTGLCQSKDESTLWLEVLPHGTLLLMGCLLASLAGAALIRVRRAVRLIQQARSAAKLEHLMIRLCLFGLLYALPALGALACLLQEAQLRPEWRKLGLLWALDCRASPSCSDEEAEAGPSSKAPPGSLELALLRILLQMLVGLASGMWVWSGKTCRAWSRLLTPPSKQTRPSGTCQQPQGYVNCGLRRSRDGQQQQQQRLMPASLANTSFQPLCKHDISNVA
ncbi:hypothetical protein QAD02_004719 [Eretmocerus hayati]|uniref:Uncharacterized protein n=1 Tax=Eretmocerus hayati TaxID=131215 RepID=A0ACC2NQR9_9HYME|nr:hypothetical protein QAD02_004719 [Eretmocerus hayati]